MLVNRARTAFIVAPLWVPMLVTPLSATVIFPYRAQFPWVVVSALLSAIFAYLGTFGLGLPLFIFLKSRRWTAAWHAIVAGALIGIFTWFGFMLCFALALDGGVAVPEIGDLSGWSLAISLAAPGFMGSLVGMTIWIIAKPVPKA